VVGSNILNVLCILGLSATIAPLVVSRQLIRIEVPLMLGLSVLVMGLGWNGHIGRSEGAALVACLLIYTLLLIRQARTDADTAPAAEPQPTLRRWPRDVSLVVVGLGLLALGARWLVVGAVSIAKALGLSDLIIGLTIVAAGTSLPEVVTSILASLRGQRDIAVGNIVGSNLFNLMGVLGLTALVAPSGIEVSDAVFGFDLPVMVAAALVCLPVFFTGGVISRWEGVVLLGYYLAYTAYLVLAANDHDALGVFSSTMLWFVLPLTVLTLTVTTLQSFRKRRPHDL
jgi:cation:H+ antiporter